MAHRALNACHNREPFKDTTVVQVGWRWVSDGLSTPYRLPVHHQIPVPMTKECQYSRRTPDPKCAGCRWNQQPKEAA